METHLPFWPPGEFIDQIAPYFRGSKEARTIMRTWNREAYRWAAPLAEPLGELEGRVLSDMYDAEVAYQDHYLGKLFDVLNSRSRHNDTLTIIVSDHGDGLGEHRYFGHAFVAYEELIHVPLLMQWPQRLPRPARIRGPVSARRIYHTILAAVNGLPEEPAVDAPEMHKLTLLHSIHGRDPEQNTAYSEIYPPLNFVRAIERRQPHLLEPFRCFAVRQALVKEDRNHIFKLIRVDEQLDELFNLAADPLELEDILAERPLEVAALNQELNRIAVTRQRQQDSRMAGSIGDAELDDQMRQRLRGLGYLD
jgi:uncharacterized sulfatase